MSGNFGGDTDLGGGRNEFPSTCWSRFLEGTDGADAAVEALAKNYWRPIYACIRAKWAKSNEDAKDLTQDFFVWMMESDFIRQADPARGRFRSFVKVALKNYVGMDLRKARRLKRGGERAILELDKAAGGLSGIEPPDPAAGTPEEILDAAWTRELLVRAEGLLEEALRNEGKEVSFRVFREFYLSPTDDVDHRTLASAHGISVDDVGNFLMSAKRRFRQIVTRLVAETVRTERDLQEEMKALFGELPE